METKRMELVRSRQLRISKNLTHVSGKTGTLRNLYNPPMDEEPYTNA